MSEAPAGPGWFPRALAVPFTDERSTWTGAPSTTWRGASPAGGASCSCTAAAPTPTGGRHVAATFADEFRVLAVDLSGHGDSDHRDDYDARAVDRRGRGRRRRRRHRRAAGRRRPQHGRLRHHRHRRPATPTDVGGRHRVRLAGDRARPRGRVVPAQGGVRPAPHLRRRSRRPSARFRTVPPQEHYLDYVIDHVARRSLRAVDGGWQWKFDRRDLRAVRRRACAAIALPYLGRGALPLRPAALRARPRHRGHRRVACTRRSAGSRPVIELPEAGHHAMLDQPLRPAHRAAHPARRLGPLRAPPPPHDLSSQDPTVTGWRTTAPKR